MASEHFKTVHFFKLTVSHGISHIRHKVVDWPRLLKEHLQQDVRSRMMDTPYGGRLVTEPVADNASQVILGKVLQRDPGLHRGSLAGEFTVVAPEAEDEFFTRVNYAQFIRDCNAFALIGGAGDTPSKSSVEILANTICPLDGDGCWTAEPIMSQAEIERFERTTTLRSVTLSAVVPPRGLFDPPDTASDLYSWSNGISTELGAQIRLRLKISLVEPRKHPEAGRRLRRLIEFGREQLTPLAKRMQVETLDEGDQEIINLLTYRMTASVPLPLPDPPLTGLDFEAFVLQQLNDVSVMMETRIIEATEG